MKALDLVLINPGNHQQIYQTLGAELAACEPPIWAGLIAAFVKHHGYSVEIVDVDAMNMSSERAAAIVTELKPRLVAVVVYGHQPSASTQLMPAAGELCLALQAVGLTAPILMLGGHVAALPERTLRDEAVDFVSTGEGLYTIIDLLDGKDMYDETALRRVRGLMYMIGDQIHTTTAPPLVTDLSSMNMLPWDMLSMDRYRAHNWHCFADLKRQPYAAVYTTLGCPYKCTFCCIQAPFKTGERAAGLSASRNSYRYWAPNVVVDQLQHLAEHYGVRNIKFADEMFVLNRKHVEGICDEIIKRGLDLNIWAYARIDTVKDGMLDKLKQAGFNWLAFGIESASERVQDAADKRFDRDDIYSVLERVRQTGIYVIANYIFGLPEDDLETMQETLDMAVDINAEFANFYSAMAYPGSPLYQQAVAEGWQLPDSWSGYSQHARDTTPLPTRYLDSVEITKFRDQAFQTYFSSQRYLDMIGRTFGPDAVDHIHDMCSHKLVRAHDRA